MFGIGISIRSITRFSSVTLLILTAVMALPPLATAQTAPIPFEIESYSLDSGKYYGAENKNAATYTAYSEIIWSPNSPWIRLNFSKAYLGKNSYITIESLKDGATQTLDMKSLMRWNYTSAYFNGDAVKVSLNVAPHDQDVFLQVKEIMAGKHYWENGGIRSICGSTDNRIPSSDDAVGRIVPIGCTGWITQNGDHVTAGHCVGSSADVIEFNVPSSASNGTIQHPGPEDQYVIDSGSFAFSDSGIGNDWGVFSVFDNSQTGLQPIQAQGSSFNLAQNLGPSTIRITGYGVDSGSANQTQQTHSGSNAGSSGTTMRYTVDTRGGNSGSPVINTANGNSVGVHTHGGCNSSGHNSGTSTLHSSFWSALGSSSSQPGSPSQLTAERTCHGGYLVDWNAPTGGGSVSEYRLYRSTNPSFSPQFLWWSGSGTITGLNAGSSGTYYIRVRACNSAGCGGYSNAISISGYSGCL